jgi:hypothetical protein
MKETTHVFLLVTRRQGDNTCFILFKQRKVFSLRQENENAFLP